ncbi:hypothetical protein ACK3TF_003988 [Chlorella vulgaris]
MQAVFSLTPCWCGSTYNLSATATFANGATSPVGVYGSLSTPACFTMDNTAAMTNTSGATPSSTVNRATIFEANATDATAYYLQRLDTVISTGRCATVQLYPVASDATAPTNGVAPIAQQAIDLGGITVTTNTSVSLTLDPSLFVLTPGSRYAIQLTRNGSCNGTAATLTQYNYLASTKRPFATGPSLTGLSSKALVSSTW